MESKKIFVYSAIIAILMSFSTVSSFADSNGIWLRAEDVLGNESGAVFGSDFPEENQNFSFYSGALNIGTDNENDNFLNFGDKWDIGFDSEDFAFEELGDKIVGIESGEGYSNNSVISVNSQEYASVDFGDGSDKIWGVGKDSSGDFYISQTGEGNRVFIEEDEDTTITMNENITINGGEVKIGDNTFIDGNLDLEDSLEVGGESIFREKVTIEGNSLKVGDVEITGGGNLDMGGNKITNLDNPDSSGDATNKDYVDERYDEVKEYADEKYEDTKDYVDNQDYLTKVYTKKCSDSEDFSASCSTSCNSGDKRALCLQGSESGSNSCSDHNSCSGDGQTICTTSVEAIALCTKS